MKRYLLWLVPLVCFLAAGCGTPQGHFPNSPTLPTGWEQQASVEKLTLVLPELQYEAQEIEFFDDDFTGSMQLSIHNLQPSTLLLAMHMDPPLWLQGVLTVLSISNEDFKEGFVKSYQDNFSNSFLSGKGGAQGISWDKGSASFEFNGQEYLHQTGSIVDTKSRERYIHEHYITVRNREFYVLIFVYPEFASHTYPEEIKKIMTHLVFK